MATKVYTGVSGVAQRVRKIYIGVNGVAQKVRKGYIGVAGVARQFFASSGKIVFKQTKLLSSARRGLGAAMANEYAVFGPGQTSNTRTGGNYDAYDASLTLTSISTEGDSLCHSYGAASIGDYAIFAGGVNPSGTGTGRRNACTSINKYLTKASMSLGLSKAKSGMGSATIGNYAIFAGGENDGSLDSVDAFDASLTRTVPTSLSHKRSQLAGACTKDYAVFGGGYNNSDERGTDWIDRYDASLTRSTGYFPGTGEPYSLAATSVGKYAIFAGGHEANTPGLSTAYSVNNSGTASIITSLSQGRGNLTAATLGDYAVFAGGCGAYNAATYTTIDTYDTSLTRESNISLTVARQSLAAISIGDYVLFGGGDTTNNLSSVSPTNAVDIYELTE